MMTIQFIVLSRTFLGLFFFLFFDLLVALFFLLFLRRSRDGYFDGVDDGVCWRLERIRAGGAGCFFWLTRGCGASDE
jgi:hypothetical protein